MTSNVSPVMYRLTSVSREELEKETAVLFACYVAITQCSNIYGHVDAARNQLRWAIEKRGYQLSFSTGSVPCLVKSQ